VVKKLRKSSFLLARMTTADPSPLPFLLPLPATATIDPCLP
jgi:hypothetical protein